MILRFLFHLFLFALVVALLIVCILFASSPFSFQKLDVARDTTLTHATTGQRVDVHFPNSSPFVLKPSVRAAQMDLLDYFTRQLSEAKISCWAVKTTLLAVKRHGQLIPWDDSISVAILHDHFETFVQLRSKLENNGTALLLARKHGYAYCVNNAARYPCIEICLMKQKDHEISICTPTNEIAACSFQDSFLRRREVYGTDMVFPLKMASLGSISIAIPNKTEDCLDIYCGKDWKTNPNWNLWKFINNENSHSLVRHFLPHFS